LFVWDKTPAVQLFYYNVRLFYKLWDEIWVTAMKHKLLPLCQQDSPKRSIYNSHYLKLYYNVYIMA